MSSLGLGALPSPHDPRDWVAEAILGSAYRSNAQVPKTLDLRPQLPKVRNQGSRGTCAAFTGALVKSWQEREDCGFTGWMSPEFVYHHRSNKPGEGMYARDVMDILKNHGCATEDKCPYQSKESPDKFPDDVLEQAKDYRIAAYARATTIEGVKQALVDSGPCLITFPVYNYTKRFWMPSSPTQRMIGGHAVTLVGYTEKGFLVQNSWGTSWGDKGYTLYGYEDFGRHWDIFASVDASGSPKPKDDKKKKKDKAKRSFLCIKF